MEISTAAVKELRTQSQAGVMECRNALIEAEGNMDKAIEILKERGCVKAAKKAERTTSQGLVECYVHTGGRIGSMVELNCETDFVARTEEFKRLAHDIAMQVAAMAPLCVSEADIPAGTECDPGEILDLMSQPFIRDPSRTIKDLVVETIAKTGENVRVSRFSRFEVGVVPAENPE